MSDCKHIDAQMMDWLYDELAPSDRAQFDHHVDACARCQGELDAFARTREAVRALPDEDPPPALSAILLHEAAKRAPAAGGRAAGIWAWIVGAFQPIMAHPAAAAVATLVLVVGVAGSLFMRSAGVETTSPGAMARDVSQSENALGRTRAAEAKLEEAPAAEPAIGDSAESDPARPAEGYAVDALDEQQKQRYGVVATTPEPRLKTLEEEAEIVLAKRKAARVQAEIGDDSGGDGDTATRRRRAPTSRSAKPPAPMANAVSSADGLLDQAELDGFAQRVAADDAAATVRGGSTAAARDSVRQDNKSTASGVAGGRAIATEDSKKRGPVPAQAARKPSPAPSADAPASPPPARAADRADRERAADKDEDKAKTGAAKTTAWARATEQRMLKAVQAKDCRTAARLAADIFDRARGYYYERIQNARAFKSCQSAFDTEQRQRARRRNRSKADSAPDFDEAMPADTAE